MQLIPRYLVKNKVDVIASDVGFVTEYRPVYSRQVKVYKGIDNSIQFRFLNADQKPIDITNEDIKFVAYDESKIKVLELTATATATKGLATLTIGKTFLEDLPQQYLSYSVYFDSESDGQVLTYSDSHFGNNGTIFLDASSFPDPRGDVELHFTAVASVVIPDEDTNDEINYWATDYVVATPSGETFAFENAIIVTPAIDSTELTIQYTTDRQITAGSKWIAITPTNVTSDSTQTQFEFDGTYNYIRIFTTVDPENITSIYLRN
jgi:hypothetical protein